MFKYFYACDVPFTVLSVGVPCWCSFLSLILQLFVCFAVAHCSLVVVSLYLLVCPRVWQPLDGIQIVIKKGYKENKYKEITLLSLFFFLSIVHLCFHSSLLFCGMKFVEFGFTLHTEFIYVHDLSPYL